MLGILEHNRSTGQVYWSDELYQILGLEPQPSERAVVPYLEQELGRGRFDGKVWRLADLLKKENPSEIPSEITGEVKGEVRGKSGRRHEIELVDADNRIRQIAFTCQRATQSVLANGRDQDPGQSPADIVRCLIFDITDEAASEEPVFDNLNLHRNICESSGSVIYAYNLRGRCIFANHNAARLFGVSREEMIGKTHADFFTSGEVDVINTHERLALINGVEQSFDLKARRGQKTIYFAMTVGLVRNAYGGSVGQFLIARDITFRREREQQLQVMKDRLSRENRLLLDSAGEGIVGLDLEGRTTFINPAAAEMLEWDPSELIGKIQHDYIHHTRMDGRRFPYQECPIYKAFRFGETQHVKKDVFWKKSGDCFFVEYISTPVMEEGQCIGAVLIFHDITERLRLEEERTQSLARERAALETARVKSQFLANISHELRTPINGVIGMTSLLIDSSLSGEQLDYANTIRDSAETLLTLINDILDLSKIEAGRIALETINFDLCEVIQSIDKTLQYAAQLKGLKLVRSMGPDISQMVYRGDPTRLAQVLTNLVSNAIKFTSTGTVEIEVRHETVSETLANVHFKVTDNGIGISREMLEQIFVPFTQADSSTTRRFGGTGLGLSICRHLVSIMGGEIGVFSEEGKGSTFWFMLPFEYSRIGAEQIVKTGSAPISLEASSPTASAAESRQMTKIPDSTRVLLAEDNIVNQKIVVKMLEKQGVRVDAVANGKEVIEALRLAPYDVILMDCQMPEMDGYEASRLIRSDFSGDKGQIPIIALTASAMEGDREKCLDAGMTDYVAKPVHLHDLLSVIGRALESKNRN
jgi:PAS domain S-box-containing protein